jgi:hypothetical protein
MTEYDLSLSVNDNDAASAIDILLIDGFSMLSYAAATEPFRKGSFTAGDM